MEVKKYNVFFVDDEPDICRVVEHILCRAHYNVRTFTFVSECLRTLVNEDCHLIISDVNMPEMNGIEFLLQIRRQYPWMPVLIITGYGNIPMAVRAVKSGAADFLEKPIDKNALLEKVKLAIEQSARNLLRLQHDLTPTELRVLELLMTGKPNKEIAQIICRSVRTVEEHRANIMHKLEARNLVDLAEKASMLLAAAKNPQKHL
jgi:two-component system response regulator FixJ